MYKLLPHPDNKLMDTLIMVVMYIGLCFFVLPTLFIFKVINSIRRLFFYNQEENMQGKVVLITGASSGIGECLAYEYAKRKASLAIVARRASRLNDVADRARALGAPDVLSLCGDVSNSDDCKKFVDRTIQYFGRLDHLLNNAGIGASGLFEDITDMKKYQSLMDINFWGSIYATHHAIPHLKKSKGKIIVNASSAAIMVPPKSSFYAASKAALISFYEALRPELSPTVSITIITLGYIVSEMTTGKDSVDGDENELKKGLPMMSTEPCAKAIVEGACKGQRYVTEPKFMRVFHLLKYLCPEFVEWYYNKVVVSKAKQN